MQWNRFSAFNWNGSVMHRGIGSTLSEQSTAPNEKKNFIALISGNRFAVSIASPRFDCSSWENTVRFSRSSNSRFFVGLNFGWIWIWYKYNLSCAIDGMLEVNSSGVVISWVRTFFFVPAVVCLSEMIELLEWWVLNSISICKNQKRFKGVVSYTIQKIGIFPYGKVFIHMDIQKSFLIHW